MTAAAENEQLWCRRAAQCIVDVGWVKVKVKHRKVIQALGSPQYTVSQKWIPTFCCNRHTFNCLFSQTTWVHQHQKG